MSIQKVGIILVNWNNWADTIECMESVFRSDYGAFRVIVCDNDSGDDSVAKIKAWAEGRLNILPSDILRMHNFSTPPYSKPIQYVEYSRTEAECGGVDALDIPLVIIKTGSNLGFAGGNNVGLRYILTKNEFQYVWLLNNDTVVASDALQKMVDRIEQSDNIGMLGSTLRNYSDGLLQAAGGGKYCRLTASVKSVQPEQAILPNTLDYISAASMLISNKFIAEVGLLSEDYFLYFEELDLAYRGKCFGYTISYAPDSIVYHKGGASIGTGTLADYYTYRNKIVFTRKHLPEYCISVFIVIILSLFNKLITGQFKRCATIVLVVCDLLKAKRAT